MNKYYTSFPRTGFLNIGTIDILGQIILLWGPVLCIGGRLAAYLDASMQLDACRTSSCPSYCWRRSSRRCDNWLTHELDQGNGRFLAPSLGCIFCSLFPQWEPFSRTQPLEGNVLWKSFGLCMWLLRPLYKCYDSDSRCRDLLISYFLIFHSFDLPFTEIGVLKSFISIFFFSYLLWFLHFEHGCFVIWYLVIWCIDIHSYYILIISFGF